jgi:hypothetical protein
MVLSLVIEITTPIIRSISAAPLPITKIIVRPVIAFAFLLKLSLGPEIICGFLRQYQKFEEVNEFL